jgi:hypothetical protein
MMDSIYDTNDSIYAVQGPTTPPQIRFATDDGLRTVLTIHNDGRLEFAPHAYPEEAVHILLNVWRQYVPQTDSEREALYSALDNMARKLTEAEFASEQLAHRIVAQYDAIVVAVKGLKIGDDLLGDFDSTIDEALDAIAKHDPRKEAE